MKYPKVVEEQLKEIVKFAGEEYELSINFIKSSLFITYLAGKIDAREEIIKEMKDRK
jgi:hypothetical protein